MAGFRKAKAEQAFIKMAIYGPPGSGKSFTTLLLCEGLAKLTGKKVAYVDSEHGTDFYAMAVKDRDFHSGAFDFDALYTRSLTEASKAIAALDSDKYCAVVIDSMTHFWEAARNAYDGKLTKIDTIPVFAWGKIKKPYKALTSYLMKAPLHVFLVGRQGNDFAEDPETGEIRMVGTKMKAEGETAYDPNHLLRMEAVHSPGKPSIITAWAEKDRSGILAGKTIQWPTFENILMPLLALMGDKQAQIEDVDDAAIKDAEALDKTDDTKKATSAKMTEDYKARFTLAKTVSQVDAISKELTPQVKKAFTASDLDAVREAWRKRSGEVK